MRTRTPRKKLRKRRKKVCVFCTERMEPDYKKQSTLRRMTTELGKIMPRRMTGVCSKHQRHLALAVKRARHIALLPFVSSNIQ